jgi:mannitol-specific phosphotransferase system IIBC component
VDFFPGTVILGFNQLKLKLSRSQFDVKVSMEPISVRLDADIVFVPSQLAEAARRAAPQSQILVQHNPVGDPRYDALVRKLEEGSEWAAARVADSTMGSEQGRIMHYRGYERVD